MLEFLLNKPVWLDRVYLGYHKYINIVLLQWLDITIPHKISENMYKYIYKSYRPDVIFQTAKFCRVGISTLNLFGPQNYDQMNSLSQFSCPGG